MDGLVSDRYMSRGSKKRQRFFWRGAKALEDLVVCEEPIYVCPICLTGFGVKAAVDGVLTLEHVPPESMGGREILLTCADCNSDAGATADVSMLRERDIRSFFRSVAGRGTYQGRVKLNMAGQRLNTEVRIEGGKVNVEVSKAINDPKRQSDLNLHMTSLARDGGSDGHKFNLSPVRGFHLVAARVAYLKSAYLAAFAMLGYRYILRPSLEPVREQIRRPKVRTLDGYMSVMKDGLDRSPLIIRLDRPFEAVVVQVFDRLVFLPPPNDEPSFYDSVREHMRQPDVATRLSGIELGWPSNLEMWFDFPKGRRQK